MTLSKNVRSLVLLTLLGFTWGSGYSLAKYAMTHGVHPLGYSFWQALGPAVLLGLYALYNNEWAHIKKIHFAYFFWCGLLGIAIPNTNMYFVAGAIPAGLLAVIVNTVPLIVYPLALSKGLETFDAFRLLAIIIGVTGIVCIIGPQQWTLSLALVQTLITPLAFAITSIYIAKYQPKDTQPTLAAFGMLFMAALMLTPLVFQAHAFYPLTIPLDKTEWVVILEILLSSLGYVLFFKLINLAGPVFYSLTGCVVALTGLFWGTLLFNEHLSAFDALGTGCVFAALFLLSWRK